MLGKGAKSTCKLQPARDALGPRLLYLPQGLQASRRDFALLASPSELDVVAQVLGTHHRMTLTRSFVKFKDFLLSGSL